TTCCFLFEYGNYCFAWGCCPAKSTTCCDDSFSCCPPDYPVSDSQVGSFRLSKDNPFGVKALIRTPARTRSCRLSKDNPFGVKALRRTLAISTLNWTQKNCHEKQQLVRKDSGVMVIVGLGMKS
ncbi:hypothetical protein RYX36_031601, partial [Vicia faba]